MNIWRGVTVPKALQPIELLMLFYSFSGMLSDIIFDYCNLFIIGSLFSLL